MLHWSISEKTLARKQVSLRCRRCASSQLRVQGHLVYMETWGLSLPPLLRSFMAQCPHCGDITTQAQWDIDARDRIMAEVFGGWNRWWPWLGSMIVWPAIGLALYWALRI